MLIKRSKGIDVNGWKYDTIIAENNAGKKFKPVELSRLLTGTTDESGCGIFNNIGTISFAKGDMHKSFEFDPLVDEPCAEWVKQIKDRVEKIAKWAHYIEEDTTVQCDIPSFEERFHSEQKNMN